MTKLRTRVYNRTPLTVTRRDGTQYYVLPLEIGGSVTGESVLGAFIEAENVCELIPYSTISKLTLTPKGVSRRVREAFQNYQNQIRSQAIADKYRFIPAPKPANDQWQYLFSHLDARFSPRRAPKRAR